MNYINHTYLSILIKRVEYQIPTRIIMGVFRNQEKRTKRNKQIEYKEYQNTRTYLLLET